MIPKNLSLIDINGLLVDFWHNKQMHRTPKAPQKETLNDFWGKNPENSIIQDNIPTKIKYHIITHEQYENILKTGWWDEFYKQFPNSQGVMTFSKVGFNKNKTEAFMYMQNERDGEVSADYYILYENIDGNWKEISVFMAWIS